MPPCASTASLISLEVAVEQADHLVGVESRSEKVVNPRRSVNITVPSTRSPPSRSSRAGALEHLVDDRLGHEAREDVVHAARARTRQDDCTPSDADRREAERGERIDERDDPAVVERELRRDREEHGRASDRGRQRDPAVQPQRERRARAGRGGTIRTMSARRRCCGAGARAATVAIAFAWISPPGISWSTGVWWMSWSDGADGPITTILSANADGGTLPVPDVRVRVAS